jgi:hypothetical protein
MTSTYKILGQNLVGYTETSGSGGSGYYTTTVGSKIEKTIWWGFRSDNYGLEIGYVDPDGNHVSGTTNLNSSSFIWPTYPSDSFGYSGRVVYGNGTYLWYNNQIVLKSTDALNWTDITSTISGLTNIYGNPVQYGVTNLYKDYGNADVFPVFTDIKFFNGKFIAAINGGIHSFNNAANQHGVSSEIQTYSVSSTDGVNWGDKALYASYAGNILFTQVGNKLWALSGQPVQSSFHQGISSNIIVAYTYDGTSWKQSNGDDWYGGQTEVSHSQLNSRTSYNNGYGNIAWGGHHDLVQGFTKTIIDPITGTMFNINTLVSSMNGVLLDNYLGKVSNNQTEAQFICISNDGGQTWQDSQFHDFGSNAKLLDFGIVNGTMFLMPADDTYEQGNLMYVPNYMLSNWIGGWSYNDCFPVYHDVDNYNGLYVLDHMLFKRLPVWNGKEYIFWITNNGTGASNAIWRCPDLEAQDFYPVFIPSINGIADIGQVSINTLKTVQSLIGGQGASGSVVESFEPTAIYTVPDSTQTVVSTIIVTNHDDVERTYDLAVVPAGSTLSVSNHIRWNAAISAKSFEVIQNKLTLQAGDKIFVFPSAPGVIGFSAFGVELS